MMALENMQLDAAIAAYPGCAIRMTSLCGGNWPDHVDYIGFVPDGWDGKRRVILYAKREHAPPQIRDSLVERPRR